MGEEIKKTDEVGVDDFRRRLRRETALLSRWVDSGVFDRTQRWLGLELETWLADPDLLPSPRNEALLSSLKDPLVVPELSQFNVELNVDPAPLGTGCLGALHKNLKATWKRVQAGARALGLNALIIGILPTLRENMLGFEFITKSERYGALNRRIMELRQGRAIHVHIVGEDNLTAVRHDVMLEAATTSMQIHLQIGFDDYVRYFNASLIASPVMAALCANSPFLFGKRLWRETRIPLFEQAVDIPGFRSADGAAIKRVGFGTGYLRNSFLEFFLENLEIFPVLLPVAFDDPEEKMRHVRLHNGTIWRWNRPLIGFNADGTPHARIEHRVPAAGPTVRDVIANIAFWLGLVEHLASLDDAPEDRIPFDRLRNDFYEAAKKGFEAKIGWIDGRRRDIQELIVSELLDAAEDALRKLGIATSDRRLYLEETVRPRVLGGQTGAAWQRAYMSTHGPDFQAMTRDYLKWQETDRPVCEWSV